MAVVDFPLIFFSSLSSHGIHGQMCTQQWKTQETITFACAKPEPKSNQNQFDKAKCASVKLLLFTFLSQFNKYYAVDIRHSVRHTHTVLQRHIAVIMRCEMYSNWGAAAARCEKWLVNTRRLFLCALIDQISYRTIIQWIYACSSILALPLPLLTFSLFPSHCALSVL